MIDTKSGRSINSTQNTATSAAITPGMTLVFCVRWYYICIFQTTGKETMELLKILLDLCSPRRKRPDVAHSLDQTYRNVPKSRKDANERKHAIRNAW
jgi:hypothetical protein